MNRRKQGFWSTKTVEELKGKGYPTTTCRCGHVGRHNILTSINHSFNQSLSKRSRPDPPNYFCCFFPLVPKLEIKLSIDSTEVRFPLSRPPILFFFVSFVRRNMSAEVTRLVPTAVRIRRDDSKLGKKPGAPARGMCGENIPRVCSLSCLICLICPVLCDSVS